jgi:catechol 2,3-dioxygenase-like lactoylglutathione lyase family enzyme
MINAIDHVVILVNNLDAAIADYSALGFTVVPGGEHADGLSHNALISLADGSYLELIAFKRPPPDEHLFAQGYKAGEGFVTFALLPTDIANDLKAIRARSLEIDGPFPGGRIRPDGQRVEWQTARPRTPDLPFLCGDVTPRELRVPRGDSLQHSNGAVGILTLTIGVADLVASRKRYRALLGVEPNVTPQGVLFPIGEATIKLVENTQQADLPLELSLTCKHDNQAAPERMDLQHTHGVSLILGPPPPYDFA